MSPHQPFTAYSPTLLWAIVGTHFHSTIKGTHFFHSATALHFGHNLFRISQDTNSPHSTRLMPYFQLATLLQDTGGDGFRKPNIAAACWQLHWLGKSFPTPIRGIMTSYVYPRDLVLFHNVLKGYCRSNGATCEMQFLEVLLAGGQCVKGLFLLCAPILPLFRDMVEASLLEAFPLVESACRVSQHCP